MEIGEGAEGEWGEVGVWMERVVGGRAWEVGVVGGATERAEGVGTILSVF